MLDTEKKLVSDWAWLMPSQLDINRLWGIKHRNASHRLLLDLSLLRKKYLKGCFKVEMSLHETHTHWFEKCLKRKNERANEKIAFLLLDFTFFVSESESNTECLPNSSSNVSFWWWMKIMEHINSVQSIQSWKNVKNFNSCMKRYWFCFLFPCLCLCVCYLTTTLFVLFSILISSHCWLFLLVFSS